MCHQKTLNSNQKQYIIKHHVTFLDDSNLHGPVRIQTVWSD